MLKLSVVQVTWSRVMNGATAISQNKSPGQLPMRSYDGLQRDGGRGADLAPPPRTDNPPDDLKYDARFASHRELAGYGEQIYGTGQTTMLVPNERVAIQSRCLEIIHMVDSCLVHSEDASPHS